MVQGNKNRKYKLKCATYNLPEPILELIDKLVLNGYISSKSEFVRICIFEWLINRKIKMDNGDICSFHDFVVDLRRSAENMWNKENELYEN